MEHSFEGTVRVDHMINTKQLNKNLNRCFENVLNAFLDFYFKCLLILHRSSRVENKDYSDFRHKKTQKGDF
jgi:hypothetical protein